VSQLEEEKAQMAKEMAKDKSKLDLAHVKQNLALYLLDGDNPDIEAAKNLLNVNANNGMIFFLFY
jgi:hypothetical protein